MAAALTLLAAACGSGRAPSPAFVQATVGAGGGLSAGGVSFRAAGAVLRMLDDGTSVTLASEAELADHLRAGMVVSVKGTLDADGRRGAATEILYRSVLRGPLAGRGESVLAVAGADVFLTADTVVLDAAGARTTVEALPAGGRVEVSGWPEGGARVRASLVRALPGAPAVTVRGWSLGAPVDGRFELSLLQRGAPLLLVDATGDPRVAQLPADALVRVGGAEVAAGAPPVLAATSVALEAQLLPLPGDRAVIEGIVTAATAADLELVVGEHRIRLTPATVYEGVPAGGAAAAALGPGIRLVAEGTQDGPALVASRVRLVDVVRLADRVAPGSFSVGNPSTTASFELGGQPITLDARTVIVGPDGAALTIRQLLELHGAEPAGLPLVVHGYTRTDSSIHALRIDVAP